MSREIISPDDLPGPWHDYYNDRADQAMDDPKNWDTSEVWEKIKALFAAGDKEGLERLYREMGITNMRAKQAQ